jgi:hypothetical protein
VKLPRYRVATVTGYPITASTSRLRSTRKPELDALVLDSLHLYKLIATYRSTDRCVKERHDDGTVHGSFTIGHEGAIQRAQEHADRLNEIHRLVLHAEQMREQRGELESS